MKLKYSIVLILLFSILMSCTKDYSSSSTIISGWGSIKENNGFDFSDNREIKFRYVDNISLEEKYSSLDFYFLYDNVESKYLFWANPLIRKQEPGFLISPDSLNPSIKSLSIKNIEDIKEIDASGFVPAIEFNSDDDVLKNPVFVIKTTESKFAVIQIEDIFIEHSDLKITFRWKFQSDGSLNF